MIGVRESLIYAQLVPVRDMAGLPPRASGAGAGLVVCTSGITIVGQGCAAAAKLTPNEMLVLGTILARAARHLGADADAADAILAAIPSAPAPDLHTSAKVHPDA